MRQLLGSRIKADALTLALSAILLVAAVWLVVDQFAGSKSPLASLLFFLALGLFLGDQFRILVTRRSR